ncbi:hypothetical protein L249_0678 [Ophiocordyceps polyrhachis-furcata BCC 54312]|uniref:MARVEL domain-containing protein n=1 Tax=Ophiocordyceps polyrhachis-furcata BCC 54312 TaxID=1330021 RepID=A0A367LC88_9HYPO|nr:hypothetical protein L249_0678 [Ophiocordyceps polyrhachis-furcata BCC 54312]
MSQLRVEEDRHVLRTPMWVLIIRSAQSVLSLLILALAAAIATRNYADEAGLALAVALLTWLAITYMTLTERLPSLRAGYHVLAVLALDGLLVVLWLAAFAALAARRALLSGYTGIEGLTSATAGLGSLQWILFIVTLVWGLVSFFKGRKQGRFPLGALEPSPSTTEECQMETKPSGPPTRQGAETMPAPSPYPTAPRSSPSPCPTPQPTCGDGQAVTTHGPDCGFQTQQQALSTSELPAQELAYNSPSPVVGSPTPPTPLLVGNHHDHHYHS